VHQRRFPRIIVLDMDSSESPTYGEQEGSAYNGHFGCTCYHPLFVFNQLGDLERCALRPGNVHSADGWRAVLEPVIVRYRGIVKRLYFRGDAAFRQPRDLRGPRSRGRRLHDPVAGQQCLAAQDRLPAEAPGRPTAA
jgi:Transposase DDE domain group 1